MGNKNVSVNCNKCTSLVLDINSERGYVCEEKGGICELFILLSTQFCCVPETDL